MEYKSIEEWISKGEELFGENYEDWEFVCPACGKVSKGIDFKNAGAETNDMYNTCIGRHNGKGVSGLKVKKGVIPEHGCDWSAFGLFGTLSKGDTVLNEGKTINVFAFNIPEKKVE